MKVILSIAKTHLLAKPKQSIVAMLGVTFGIGMFITMISLMTGLNNFTEELTMSSTPDIRIYKDITAVRSSILDEVNPAGLNWVHHQKPKNESIKIKNAYQIAAILQSDPQVLGAAPQLSSRVFYNYGPVQLNGLIAGVDILEEDKLFDIASKMKAGNINALQTSTNSIIMGSGLARKLSAKVGDRVNVTTPGGFTLNLKIVGIFQIGIGEVDNVKSYADIATVQKIMEKDASYITEIKVKLVDLNQAKIKAAEIQNTFGYKAEDWETANSTYLTGAIIRNIMTVSVSVTLLIVAGFGIYNIMNMTIFSKMKDIAILKATGFSAGDVRSIFLAQSLVIGVLGSSLGLIMGFILSYMISLAPFDAGDFLSITSLPVNFNPLFYFFGIGFGVITTAIAGYMPSRKAGKIDPIEIIRGI